MDKINQIIADMENLINNPSEVVKKFKDETGNKVIGCLPIYVPEEIVHAGGMLPIGIWGGQTDIVKAGKYLPSFACSIMRVITEFAINGVYDELDAAIVPAHCDTLKCIGENWDVMTSYKVPHIGLYYPQNRKIAAGIKFLMAELEQLKKRLEEISGTHISDEAINNSINVYNEYRETMRKFCEVAVDYPSIITPKVRHKVIKASYFNEKSKHTAMVKELITELTKLPKEDYSGFKVVITGILAEPDSYLDLFNDYGMTIVADDLAHESRQFRYDVPLGNSAIERLANRWSFMEGCALIYDPEKLRGQMLIDMVKKYNAHGVVVSMMKFCEPEEFDYPIYKKELEANNIPILYIEIEQHAGSVEQLRTRMQGFSEMLKVRN